MRARRTRVLLALLAVGLVLAVVIAAHPLYAKLVHLGSELVHAGSVDRRNAPEPTLGSTADPSPPVPPEQKDPAPPRIVVNAQVARPAKISAVSSRPGPGVGVGEATISWTEAGPDPTEIWVQTGLSSFSPTIATMTRDGRHPRWFRVSGSRRSVTLTAQQASAAGAAAGSSNHLYFRLSAVNHTSLGDGVRAWPHLETAAVRPPAPSTAGVPLRIASFNVRTAHATQDKRSWLQRAPAVAATIVAHHPGVVALQELGPYAADGTTGSNPTDLRQTTSLLDALAAVNGSQYKLVRTTGYMPPHTPQGTQGERILYDSSRYHLLSACDDSSAGGDYSSSCTVDLPLLPDDPETYRRKAAYAEFADLVSGRQFFVVSVHLDARQGTDAASAKRLDILRASQIEAVMLRLNELNPTNLPIIIAGDTNSWQNDKAGFRAHDALITGGYFDTAAATTQVNLHYSTVNAFVTTMPAPLSGYGARLDQILVKGVTGASYFENVMKRVDPDRPSDHNLVVADLKLP